MYFLYIYIYVYCNVKMKETYERMYKTINLFTSATYLLHCKISKIKIM